MADKQDVAVCVQREMAASGPDQLTAEEAFSSCREMLEIQLELSVNSVASSAFSAGLIDNQLLTSVIRKQHLSQFERTLCLLLDIQSEMLQPGNASVVMEKFIKILEEEAAYRYLATKISENIITLIRYLTHKNDSYMYMYQCINVQLFINRRRMQKETE